ncbi:MAG: hypothetical protein ABUS54_10790 [Actinomycetota bacterium]
MRIKRLVAATLVCASVVLGVSLLAGSGRAASRPSTRHSCSAADKQFLQTVSQNMTQLGYWSDELLSNDATPALVVSQAKSESAQVQATRPLDPSLRLARSLLAGMFTEYAAAVHAKAKGGDAGRHMGKAYQFANVIHDVLVTAQPALTPMGCDVSPLLQA